LISVAPRLATELLAPVETVEVHEVLRPKLCDLYENDCIFDKFQASWSGDDSCILTGSYNNVFRVFHRDTGLDVALEASRDNITTAAHTLEPVNFISGPAKATSPPQGPPLLRLARHTGVSFEPR